MVFSKGSGFCGFLVVSLEKYGVKILNFTKIVYFIFGNFCHVFQKRKGVVSSVSGRTLLKSVERAITTES